MLKISYQVKSGFTTRYIGLEVEESQLSPEDYAFAVEQSATLGGTSILKLRTAKFYQGFGSPYIAEPEYVAEDTLTVEQALDILKAFVTEKARINADMPAIIAQYQAEKKAKALIDAEAKRLADEQKAIAYAAKMAAAVLIEWNSENKAILNLYQRLATLSEIEMDTRFSNWIKRVDNINKAAENGYCFEGAWVNDKTIEIENKPAVFIVAGTSGSRKYATTHYRVVILRDGKLEATDITADNSDAGWALLIRDKVAALLNQ